MRLTFFEMMRKGKGNHGKFLKPKEQRNTPLAGRLFTILEVELLHMSETICLNCQAESQPSQKFCSQCGQKLAMHRITLPHFLHDFFHALTHTDKGIFHLLKGMATRPGVVAREYIAGKRKKYFNPFTFFLILAGLYVFSSSMSSDRFSNSEPKAEVLARIPTEEGRQKYIRGIAIGGFMNKHGNILAMIAVPFMAFIAWLFYRKNRYNYAEHLTANLMFVTFSLLVFTLLVFPLQGLYRGSAAYKYFIYGGLLLQAIYYTWCYYQFLQYDSFGKGLKAFLVSLLSVVLWSVLTLCFIAIYIYRDLNFYQFFTQMSR